jgi:Protein of unknown function (DUF3182)
MVDRERPRIRRMAMAETVVVYFSPVNEPMYEHERATLHAVAGRIAELKQCEFAGLFSEGQNDARELFFVPDETLTRTEAARLGIRRPTDFFGGTVPHAFVGTKAITHQLADAKAERPPGWSTEFARRVGHVVLPGYTVFDVRDAQVAARRLFRIGPVRLKNAFSAGGGGQTDVKDRAELDALLEQFPHDQLAAHGLVLETCLREVVTRSIGQIFLCGRLITYHGVQRTAANNEGRTVYAGSHLVCVQGGWEALDRMPMSADTRRAVRQAVRYDAAMEVYPGFMASRRNYDVAQGIDGAGQERSGVLEASWRSGGASTAELEALACFIQDPEIQVVEACAVKHFGGDHHPPRRAIVHFDGDDPRDGPIMRYTVVTACDRLR